MKSGVLILKVLHFLLLFLTFIKHIGLKKAASLFIINKKMGPSHLESIAFITVTNIINLQESSAAFDQSLHFASGNNLRN